MRKDPLLLQNLTFIALILLPFIGLAGDPPVTPEDKFERMVQAYPNPTSALVNVRISDDQFQLMTLSLEDTKGKVLLKDKITRPGVHTVNMRLLSQGSYVLHLQSEDGSIDEHKPIQKIAP